MAISLSAIREKIDSLRKKRDSLKLSRVEDSEAVGTQRLSIDQQILLLEEAHTAEIARREAEAAEKRKDTRYKLLIAATKKAQEKEREYNALTSEAAAQVKALVATLAKRERLFTLGAVGLHSNEAQDLITPDEWKELSGARDSSFVYVTEREFGAVWGNAVSDETGNDKQLARLLNDLVVPPPLIIGAPITKGFSMSRSALSETARELAIAGPRQAHVVERAQPAARPSGLHQTIDIRDERAVAPSRPVARADAPIPRAGLYQEVDPRN